jgi:hypothetical protein
MSEKEIDGKINHLREKSKGEPLSYEEVSESLGNVYSDHCEIVELIKFVTHPSHKTRYNTQFFVLSPKKEQFINIGVGLKTPEKIYDDHELALGDESESMVWTNPAKMMKMYLEKEATMAQPIFLVTNILLNFKTSSELIKYLNTVQYLCLNSFTENILERQCLTFPFNIAF